MSLEANKQLVRAFLVRFSANNLAGALDCMTDDATWWIAVDTIAESRNVVSSISCENRSRMAAVAADAAFPLFPLMYLLIINRLTIAAFSC